MRLANLQEHLDAENAHDLEAIMRTYAADPVVVLNGFLIEGAEAVREFHARFGFGGSGSFSEVRVTERHRHVTDEAIVIEQVLGGRHTGDYQGLAATGRTFAVRVCTVYRFDVEGRLASEDVYFDTAYLRRQLER